MGRVKGSKNTIKNTPKITSEERIRIFTNLIVDRIFEEKEAGRLDQIIKQCR